MSARERDQLVNFRVKSREWQLIKRSAKAAGVTVSDYIRQRVGVSNVAMASELTEVMRQIAAGKVEPVAAIRRMMNRLEWSVKAWLELVKLLQTFNEAQKRLADFEQIVELANRVSEQIAARQSPDKLTPAPVEAGG